MYLFIYLGRAAWHVELPRPGIEPMPPALQVRSLNHWTNREVPTVEFKFFPFQPIYLKNFPIFKDTFQRCFFWLRRSSSHAE